jgi:hypothetical protein
VSLFLQLIVTCKGNVQSSTGPMIIAGSLTIARQILLGDTGYQSSVLISGKASWIKNDETVWTSYALHGLCMGSRDVTFCEMNSDSCELVEL